MPKAQYGILRFHKYKGPEIGQIEAHNERTKEKYASNPDIDPARKHLNFNLLTPPPKYRAEAERQIREAGCRTRKDSVRLVETLITASPEFFLGKSHQEIRGYFERALEFMKTKQDPNTFVSAVVHMDEKTPHMHLCFVPITEDGRLSAKDIVGNRKKLTQWQDEYWSYMVKKYPDLERGESASETGRTHLPPRIFKQATRMHRLEQKLKELLSSINPMNAKRVREEILKVLDEYIPGVAELMTKSKALKKAEKELKAEIAMLKKEANVSKPSVQRLLELEKKVQEHEELQHTVLLLQQTLTAIPPEIIAEYNEPKSERKETIAIE
ncbi:MAG: MobV family relaxase [Oscillospiraceae bacterium]|nr:MobV family relaxase [Oscillospiraceae bacterium]